MAKNDARTQNTQKNATKNTSNPTNAATKPAQTTKPSGAKQK